MGESRVGLGSAVPAWTWIGSLLERAHHVSLCRALFIYWKINFKMMLLGLQGSCCMSCLCPTSNIDRSLLLKCFTSLSTERKSGHVRIDFTFEYVLNGFCSPRAPLWSLMIPIYWISRCHWECYLQLVTFLQRHRARHLTSAPRKH